MARDVFAVLDFDSIRPLFGGHFTQPQVDGINDILDAWHEWGDDDLRKLAYLLATVFHETARTMQPVKEYGSTAYLKAKRYYPYVGRGHIQLTWDYNYAKVGRIVGVDLVGNPDKALDPKLSARIAVQGCIEGWFTGKRLADYITARECDYENARRVVNGKDRAKDIATYAMTFERALSAQKASVTTQEPRRDNPQARRDTAPATGLWAALAGIFNAIVSAFTKRSP